MFDIWSILAVKHAKTLWGTHYPIQPYVMWKSPEKNMTMPKPSLWSTPKITSNLWWMTNLKIISLPTRSMYNHIIQGHLSLIFHLQAPQLRLCDHQYPWKILEPIVTSTALSIRYWISILSNNWSIYQHMLTNYWSVSWKDCQDLGLPLTMWIELDNGSVSTIEIFELDNKIALFFFKLW